MGALLRALFSPIGNGAGGCIRFLALIFILIALVGLALGFNLGEIDAWIDAQSVWVSVLGTWLFRFICGLVLLPCIYVVGYGLLARVAPAHWNMTDGFGCLAMICAAIIGYFAWFGVIS